MINFKTTKSYLSRDEMRMIGGGTKLSDSNGICFTACKTKSDCAGEGDCTNCIKAIDSNDGECGS